MNLRVSFAFLGGLSLAACAYGGGAELASIKAIYESPQTFSGKRVRLEGYLTGELESVGIYSSIAGSCGDPGDRFAVATDTNETGRLIAKINRGDRVHVVLEGLVSDKMNEAPYRTGMTTATDGDLIVHVGAVGPGPLTNIRVLQVFPEPVNCREKAR